ncbi:ABC transporter ATP-binding protein [Desulfosediminicola ganghwensis]|uniref:ABC transporter ATP-binding protein n=1 Tax=Desulfosediminicola ganghwensis TaxID=2569540 RepID=UPI0010AC374D|nr:ABC transporter ATP-binding protein [Desulfosediminicola ganghwensis]
MTEQQHAITTDIGPAISVSKVSFQYRTGDVPALNDVSFQLSPATCTLVRGESGSGKTTLCYCLKGLIPQAVEGDFSGQLEIAGMDVTKYRIQTLSRHIGFVLQDPEVQIVGRNVYEDLIFGPRNLLIAKETIVSDFPSVLQAVGLEGYEGRETYQLSGGEKQRLAIAGVLLMKPQVLILDEPSSELDPAGRRNLYDLLLKLKREEGLSLVIVDQQLPTSHPLVDEVLFLKDGELKEADSIGECSVPCTLPPVLSSNEAPTVLTVENLSFAYRPETPVLKNISMEIRQQDFLALVGHNGSGKTTLAMHLNRLLKPQKGTVSYQKKSLEKFSRAEIARSIGFVFQNPDHQIFETSVEKEIAFGLVQQGINTKEIKKKVEEVLGFMALEDYRDHHPATLPKGIRQFISVASIVALSPEILVVDEPTTGLDTKGKEIILSRLRELNDRGTAIVMITHDMELVREHCSRLLLLEQGEIKVNMSTASALQSIEFKDFIGR